MEKERCFILILCIEQNEASTIDFDKKKSVISTAIDDLKLSQDPGRNLKILHLFFLKLVHQK